jgi:hypothetical protein
LLLDDPVLAYVPELPGIGWANRATVRDLSAAVVVRTGPAAEPARDGPGRPR